MNMKTSQTGVRHNHLREFRIKFAIVAFVGLIIFFLVRWLN